MTELFKDKTTFNGNISSWDVSNVTNMSAMFRGSNLIKIFQQKLLVQQILQQVLNIPRDVALVEK